VNWSILKKRHSAALGVIDANGDLNIPKGIVGTILVLDLEDEVVT